VAVEAGMCCLGLLWVVWCLVFVCVCFVGFGGSGVVCCCVLPFLRGLGKFGSGCVFLFVAWRNCLLFVGFLVGGVGV